MPGTPDISKDIFDSLNGYMSRIYQQGRILHDWDVNDSEDMRRYWLCAAFRKLTTGRDNNDLASAEEFAQIHDDSAKAFQIVGVGLPQFSISKGLAFSAGRPLITGTLLYNSNSNYIEQGAIELLQEETPSTSYFITDVDVTYEQDHMVEGALLTFTSGALDTQTFSVVDQDTGRLRVSGDISTAIVGDTYILKPRAIPAGGGGAFDVILINWWQKVSYLRDPDLLAAGADEPSWRWQLRWCVQADPPRTISNGADPLSGFRQHTLASIDYAGPNIVPADVTNVTTYYSYSIEHISKFIEENSALLAEKQHKWNHSPPMVYAATSATRLKDTTVRSQYFDGGDPFPSGGYLANFSAGGTGTVLDNSSGPEQHTEAKLAIDVVGSYISNTAANTVEQLQVVASATFNNGTPNWSPINLFPLADIPRYIGMDWDVWDGINIPYSEVLTIEPGAWKYGDTHYIQHTKLTVPDITINSAWVSGTAPGVSGSIYWAYIYLATNAETDRSLQNVLLDTVAPNWAGVHPIGFSALSPAILKVMPCIGVFPYINTGGIVGGYQAFSRDNRVFLGSQGGSGIPMVTVTIDSFETPWSIQPIQAITEFDVVVEESTASVLTTPANAAVLDLYCKDSTFISWKESQQISVPTAGNASGRITGIRIPGRVGTTATQYYAKSSNFSTIDLDVVMTSYKLSLPYSPSSRTWK
jgi:hypothetical protein